MIRAASRTAIFVAQARALAHDEGVSRHFNDPVARTLLRDDELRAVDDARERDRPAAWRDRKKVQAIETCAEVVVPRTVTIDEAIASAANPQVVILGAGLDARPFRLACLRDAAVFAIDHPASLADAMERIGDEWPPITGSLHRLAVDLSVDDLGSALEGAGFDPSAPTTWVWEGVVPYLRAADVRAVVKSISALSAAGSRLVVYYQASSLTDRLRRRAASLFDRLTGLDDPFADEPWLSVWRPSSMQRVMVDQGLRVMSDVDMLTAARRLGSPATRPRLLANGRVLVACR